MMNVMYMVQMYSCVILVSTVYFANIGGYPFKVEDALDYPLLGT